MVDSLVTHLQIFGIGFSFGLAGPCILACAPVLMTFVVGSKRTHAEAFRDIVIFLSGRLIAYCALGFLAGLSADVLRRFVSSAVSMYFRPLAGAVTMLFAFLVLLNRDNYECPCPEFRGKALGLTGAFVFGLVIGLSPCVPLSALLFDIVLMSKGALDGASYAFSFGLGTFISGLITIGIITGLLVRVPASFVRSKAVNTAFKVTLAALLFLLGAGMIVDNIRF